MTDPRPLVLATAPLPPPALAALVAAVDLRRLWEAPDPQAMLAELGPQVRGITASTLLGRVDDALLARLPALEIVASFGVGYDNIDAAAAAARGVVVTNTPGVLDEEVADLALGLLIATLRRLPQADRFVRDGRWPDGPFPLSPTLRGRRVGIVGLGAIGKAIARRLDAARVAVAYHGRTPQPDVPYAYHPTAQALAAASDVLVAIVPGGAGTRHLIDAAVLDALGPDGVLINVARGSVVDEDALIAALTQGRIGGAGLDVYADEPRVPAALMAMPNVVLLPHLGSASEHTRTAMGQLVADNLVAWFTDRRPPTPVPETRHLVEE